MSSTEYLADRMIAMSKVKVPPKANITAADRDDISKAILECNAIKGRELYSFTRKALFAAADLRVDTPERMERLIDAVAREPLSVFLEADLRDLVECLSGIRGFLDPAIIDLKHAGNRIGFMVDCPGDGTIEFRPVWLYSRDLIAEIMTIERGGTADIRSMPPALRTILPMLHQLRFGHSSGKIDPHRHIGLSRHEFETALERAGRGDPLLEEGRAAIRAADGVRKKAEVTGRFWRMARFRDLIETTQHHTTAYDPFANSALAQIGSPVHVGLHIIAMLALLSAEAREIALFRPRDAQSEGDDAARSGRGRPAPSEGRPANSFRSDDIRVVSLNINMAERDIERASRGEGAGGHKHTDPSGRARHPVRGHLFLARNGKIVWRSAHWRGTLDQTVIRRVTAT